MKVDRRKDKNCECVDTKKGEELQIKINADAFWECSSKSGTNVKEVFKSAIEAVKGRADEKAKAGCVIC